MEKVMLLWECHCMVAHRIKKTLRGCLSFSLCVVFLPTIFSLNWRDADLMDGTEWVGYSHPESSDLWLNVQLKMGGVPQDLYWDMDFIHDTGGLRAPSAGLSTPPS